MESCICWFNVCESPATAAVVLMGSNRHPLDPPGGKQAEKQKGRQIRSWTLNITMRKHFLYPQFSSMNQTVALLGRVKNNKGNSKCLGC